MMAYKYKPVYSIVLQAASKEEDSNSEIFLKDLVVSLNNEEKIIESVRETSEVEIPKEMY